MSEAPRIETARLILRQFEARDLDPHVAMLADPVVMRHLGAPAAREDAWRRLLQAPGLWALLGYGYWAVERRGDGAFLGQLGFADFKREIDPPIEGLPEMGWLLATEAHGRGYASEGVAAALDWADATLGASEIVAIIAPENEPSIRLAVRAGFERAEGTIYKGDPTLIFRRRYDRNESG
ncbi:MAG TPA: GNAT family N-acetyltransferase, partial [Allosphingosinicella sp.]